MRPLPRLPEFGPKRPEPKNRSAAKHGLEAFPYQTMNSSDEELIARHPLEHQEEIHVCFKKQEMGRTRRPRPLRPTRRPKVPHPLRPRPLPPSPQVHHPLPASRQRCLFPSKTGSSGRAELIAMQPIRGQATSEKSASVPATRTPHRSSLRKQVLPPPRKLFPLSMARRMIDPPKPHASYPSTH